jgi:IPT/TIG domain/NHL repeat
MTSFFIRVQKKYMKYISLTRTGLWTLMIPLAIVSMTGCKKEQNPPNPGGPGNPNNPSNLSISGIKPASGAYNTAVTIKGTGFSSNLANDSVYFNGVAATLYSANDSQMVVVVQKYTGTGDVVVKVAGVEKTGPLFTYNYTALENTYAGAGNSDVFIGSSKDGPAATAGFFLPAGLVLDKTGNLFVYDLGNGEIREITPSSNTGGSMVSTLYTFGYAGGGIYANHSEFIAGLAYQGGTFFTGFTPWMVPFPVGTTGQWIPPPNKSAGGAETLFPLNNWSPEGVATDRSGNIYAAADNYIFIIYKNGPISWTSIGTGQKGSLDGTFSLNIQGQAVPADEPSFSGPSGVAVDSLGNIFVADPGNNKIRKIDISNGAVSTFAGSGNQAEKDGTGSAASFFIPLFITIDGSGNLYVGDYNNGGEALRMITPTGVVSTLCTGCLNVLGGIAVDYAGHNIYTTEYFRSVIDQITIY